MTRSFMLVATEASGDVLGAELIGALRGRLGADPKLSGVGGPLMAAEGVTSLFPIDEFSIVGFFDGLLIYRRVLARVEQVVERALAEKPDAIILIDSWGFMIRVAERLKARGFPGKIIKYVGPQVWATRAGRAKKLAAAIDLLLATHVKDAPYYEGTGLPVVHVGLPVLHRDLSGADPVRGREAMGAAPGQRILLVLPGSRRGEIQRMSASFAEAVEIVTRTRPDLRVALPIAETVRDDVRAAIENWRVKPMLVEPERKFDVMRAATAALACSGTVTTELALAGCPMVVAYRMGDLSYAVVNSLYTQRYITLFNIAADQMIAREFRQGAVKGPALAEALAPLLDDKQTRDAQAAAQTAALDLMGRGGPHPAERAAAAILDFLQ